MTTRLKGLTVLLEQDIREDDAERIIEAIEMVKGVQQVQPVETDSEDWMNRERVRQEFRERIWDALNDDN